MNVDAKEDVSEDDVMKDITVNMDEKQDEKQIIDPNKMSLAVPERCTNIKNVTKFVKYQQYLYKKYNSISWWNTNCTMIDIDKYNPLNGTAYWSNFNANFPAKQSKEQLSIKAVEAMKEKIKNEAIPYLI